MGSIASLDRFQAHSIWEMSVYNIAIAPSFHVTADFQFINPTRESVDPSVFCGLRAKIDF